MEIIKEIYSLAEAVEALVGMGFTGVNVESLRRWETIENLIRPMKRIKENKMRAYSPEQIKKLATIALMKQADFNANEIRVFLTVKSKSIKETLRRHILARCIKTGNVLVRAEEILA